MESFNDIFIDDTKNVDRISVKEYLDDGKIAIIDQGKEKISGYTNCEDYKICKEERIIFGDHTRIFKYINIPFITGADGTKVLKIRNTNKCNYKFLYYYLLHSYIPNTGYNRHFKWVKELRFNVPTIDKQMEISNKLDKIQNIIDIRKKQIDELDQLIKSQFVEMFGDIENTKYDVYKLSELTNLITDGEHKKPNYTENGTPFISVVNITTGELKFEDCKFVSEEDAYKFNKRCNPEKDDILYTKVGATYGRSAIVDTEKKFALYVSVCLIKPKKDLINPIFLNYTMRQPYVKSQADKCIKGIGVPDLHLIEIKNFKIILPPIEEQNQFAEFVKLIDKQKFEIEKSLKEMQELYESLMDKYFG